MAQKTPNARERFETAALTLFAGRGYAGTTARDIAARAGLTERTFFRYFADKPEVLFWRAGELQINIVDGVEAAPAGLRPLAAVCVAFEAAGAFFDANRAKVAARQNLVAAHPELRARELMKGQSLAAALTAALRKRGLPEPTARMASEAGVSIWQVALEQWTADPRSRGYSHHVRTALGQLEAAVVGSGR